MVRKKSLRSAHYSLEDIRAFTEAARLGTLSSAGLELNVPASTISRAIDRIESFTGLLLVQRSPGGLALTDAGKEYAAACATALGSLREGDNVLDRYRTQPAGNLRILCPYIFARDVLAPVLPLFTKVHPELMLDIALYASRWDQEPKNDTDIVFKVMMPKDSARRVQRFPAANVGLFASPDYVAREGLPARPSELAARACIGAAPSPEIRWTLTRGTESLSQAVSCTVRSVEPELRLGLALAGQGIAPMPMWLALRPQYADRLVQVLPRWRLEPTTLSALYYGTAKQSPKVKVFLDFVTEFVGTERDPRLVGAPYKRCFVPVAERSAGPR